MVSLEDWIKIYANDIFCIKDYSNEKTGTLPLRHSSDLKTFHITKAVFDGLFKQSMELAILICFSRLGLGRFCTIYHSLQAEQNKVLGVPLEVISGGSIIIRGKNWYGSRPRLINLVEGMMVLTLNDLLEWKQYIHKEEKVVKWLSELFCDDVTALIAVFVEPPALFVPIQDHTRSFLEIVEDP